MGVKKTHITVHADITILVEWVLKHTQVSWRRLIFIIILVDYCKAKASITVHANIYNHPGWMGVQNQVSLFTLLFITILADWA